jgi:hypothetical protein
MQPHMHSYPVQKNHTKELYMEKLLKLTKSDEHFI